MDLTETLGNALQDAGAEELAEGGLDLSSVDWKQLVSTASSYVGGPAGAALSQISSVLSAATWSIALGALAALGFAMVIAEGLLQDPGVEWKKWGIIEGPGGRVSWWQDKGEWEDRGEPPFIYHSKWMLCLKPSKAEELLGYKMHIPIFYSVQHTHMGGKLPEWSYAGACFDMSGRKRNPSESQPAGKYLIRFPVWAFTKQAHALPLVESSLQYINQSFSYPDAWKEDLPGMVENMESVSEVLQKGMIPGQEPEEPPAGEPHQILPGKRSAQMPGRGQIQGAVKGLGLIAAVWQLLGRK